MYSSLVELLRRRAIHQSQDTGYVYLVDGEREELNWSYAELDRRARAVAATLQSLCVAGERALLLYPPGLDYIAAFFGCLYAKVIAVPAYPPDPARPNRALPRLRATLADAKPSLVLTTGLILNTARPVLNQAIDLQNLPWHATDQTTEGAENAWRETRSEGDSIAFLQYTSGSTGAPKGVIISQANLLHNAASIYRMVRHSPSDKYVSWLPTFHDMGFMAGIIEPLYAGIPAVLMSPLAFLQKPFRWLSALSRYKATTSGGPNFAYDLCVRKVSPEQRATLDLSSWSVAFNGAEPVRQETLERFVAAFSQSGFQKKAFFPCYGLAEATLIVAGADKDSAPAVSGFDPKALEDNRVVESAPEAGAHCLVSSGKGVPDQQLLIVHPELLTECRPGEVGEIWVSGPSVARGYWNQPEETKLTFYAHIADFRRGPFLRTGDLGFFHNGELFVTGRLKDLIIIRGANHYPQDIEITVERSHKALRQGCGAAFSISVDGQEVPIVVQELDKDYRGDTEPIINAIRENVSEAHDVRLSAVVLLEPGSIPKTSSGKIQRYVCRAGFLASTLRAITEWREDAPVTTEPAIVRHASQPSYGEIELRLIHALAAFLKLDPERIEIHQPVTRYGLDSLLAIELEHSLEEEWGASLTAADFLSGYSIEQLAALFRQRATDTDAAHDGKTRLIESGGVKAQLSYGQKALLFIQQLAPEASAYNVASALRIRARLNERALKRSLDACIERHPSLRSTFNYEQGQTIRRTQARLVDYFHRVDASNWSEAALNQRLADETHKPFDLEEGPLLRVSLLVRSSDEAILLLVAHHLVCDLWSLALMVDDLGRLYESESLGIPAALHPISYQYGDYVRWQEKLLASAEGERLRDYWQGQLAGELPLLELPTDRPRPPVQGFKGASLEFALSREVTERLEALARSEDATLYMVLLAAFQILLYRYTGQQDILVGSPAAGRERAEFSRTVGYFVNPIVLRALISRDQSAKSFLRQVKQTVIDAFRHQAYPLALLAEQLQPNRDQSHPPLFQVMLAFQKSHLRSSEELASLAVNDEGARLKLGNLPAEVVAIEQRTAQFDLTLTAARTRQGLSASFRYSTDLFDAATVSRMAGHLYVLFEAIASNVDCSISESSILTTAEQHQLLVEWNSTEKDYSRQHCLHHLFEEQTRRTPDAIAVVFQDAQLTYRRLNERANQLAHCLIKMGVGPDSVVPLYLERSPEMVVGLLGALKAGAVFLPLEPGHPAKRVIKVLDDVSAPVVLTQQRFASDAALDKVNVLCLDSQWDSLSEESSTNPDARASLDSLAYIIYTSGSTGTPKGVMNHHRGISNRLLWMQETYRATSSDVVLQKTPYSFDVSVWELFWPLISGARLIMAEPGSHRESFSLSRLISLREITIAHFVPSMLQVFLDEPSLDGCQSLRLVVCSGEALTLELQDRFFKLLGSQLHNLYGPTEAAVDVTFWQCSQSGRKAVPIGRPIANTKIYLLDADSRPAPIGVPGQLHIGGVCLARGYYGNPAQTAEKFVPDPFSPAGARLYATGDLARYAADGNIEFLGRLDHQVKIRGMRIEMSEIETVLNQWPPIKEAIVTAREDGPGNQCLVAYLVAHSGIEVETDSLRRYLRDHLPEHMIPSILMTVDRFTLTANGKVDRRALPVPERSSYERRLRHTPAQTPIQQEVARVWKSVLRVNRPGIYENFLELGGHSLLATQVISRLRNTFQVELSLRSLFESPTIAGLAGEIETLLRGAQAHRLPPITPLSRQGDLPLSFAQQRLWFLDQFEPESYAYNMPGIVRLAGKLDVSALEQSLNEVIRRHESLRAVFTSTGGQPSQRISPIRQLRLGVIDLSGLPEALREDQVSRLSIEAARRPFDLAKGPLIREKLLRLSDERHVLLLTMHHIVSDGWSLGVLLEEMVAFYEALSGGKPFAMPEPPVQYTDFAQWQQQWLRGEVLERQLSYWKQQLGDDPPPLELPTDRPRLNSFTVRGAREGFSLSHNLSEDIRSLGQRESATLFMVLLAAFQTLLHRYGGRNDILVGSPIAGRNHFELERLIGFFVNTVVVRGDLSGDPGFRTLLNRVRETALEAYAHQDVPFEKVVEAVQPARTLMHTPLFQVMFDLQEAITPEIKLADLTLSGLETDNGAAKFDLTLTMADSPSAIEATVEYNSDLFDAPTISRMVDHFKVLLKGILADPDKNISSLPLLTDAEQHQLLVEWNSNHAAYPEQVCIHQLFEEQAERNPDKVAVVYEQQQFTYGEMNQQANRLAHRLLADGVGPDRCVGIYMYRSPEAILAVLATLKAGGTYLPLDPTYANDRLAFMLRDSRACLTITTADLFSQLPAPEIKAIPFNMSLIGDELHVNKATPSSEVTSRNMAYVVYTSGSTGLPKGVMVTHHSLVNAFYGWEKAYSLSSSATSHLQIAGFGFDVFSGDWVRALCSGAKLVLCPFEVLLNAERLYRLMREEQLDCGEFTPATLTHLGRYLQESGKKLDFMRLLIVGSDTWHIQKHEQLRRLCGNDTRLINSYGLTETTIDSSYFEGDFSYRSTEDTVPIGRPFANTGMYLLDWHAQPVPIGVAAEGYIGGPSLTRGYLNRADLTAASFIPNPFSDAPGERLYRTGDLGRFLPNGNIAFLGRADAQVKIRGLRIELGEIEAALGGHTDIEDCVVLARALSLTEKQLVAFITLKQGANTSTNDFRRFLKKSLPDYMLPAAFVVLDKLPVTPNGKVDRGALQAAEITLPERRVGFITPSSATERSVAEIWSGVLGIEQVGALDDFFGLGGHSLLAAQVVSRLNRAFKIEITIRELFAESTVAGLSALIEQKQLQQADDDKLALMLAEVNELSDEEAEALLAAEEMLSKET